MGLGMGQVRIPAYLFNDSIAVYRGTNEIQYLDSGLWAERLDSGLQRVVAANLATLLSTDRIYLSSWATENVAAQVHVTVERFDVEASGRTLLAARWRVLSPGGETLIGSGRSRLVGEGPAPESDTSGAVATMSGLVGDLSRELAKAIQGAAGRVP
jgi:uncharacterized lipoprotein YmbA